MCNLHLFLVVRTHVEFVCVCEKMNDRMLTEQSRTVRWMFSERRPIMAEVSLEGVGGAWPKFRT